MNKFRMLRLVSMAIIFVAYKWSMPTTRPQDPPHKVSVSNDILDDKQHNGLMELFADLGDYHMAKTEWISTKWTSFGEEYDPTSDMQCSELYTVVNPDTNKCQFPNRLDVVSHYFESGGYDGLKQPYNKMMHTLDRFTQNIPLDTCSSEFTEIFQSEAFENSVQDICGRQNPYFRPFQLQLVLQIPGKAVAQHLDPPYFWPATRYAFPEWLLAVMQDSQLFDTQRIPQVQSILYVHDWNVDNKTNMEEYNAFGGHFVAYSKGAQHKPQVIPAAPRSAVFCDGSQMVHGTSVYRPDVDTMDIIADDASLRFDKEANVWRLYVNNAVTDAKYSWKEIRASVVYRGWCFSDKEIMESWDAKEWSGDWSLEDVLDILKRDLIYEKKAISVDKWDRMNQAQIALYLIKQYIKLPKPALARLPFNYCAKLVNVPVLNMLC